MRWRKEEEKSAKVKWQVHLYALVIVIQNVINVASTWISQFDMIHKWIQNILYMTKTELNGIIEEMEKWNAKAASEWHGFVPCQLS